MLDYLQKSTEDNVVGEMLQEIHQHVKRVKILPEVKQDYMLFGEKIDYERKEAKIEQAVEFIFECLGEYGELSDDLSVRIQNEDDLDTLKKWQKLAARCGSLEAFEEQM